jgi:hypothetical protein
MRPRVIEVGLYVLSRSQSRERIKMGLKHMCPFYPHLIHTYFVRRKVQEITIVNFIRLIHTKDTPYIIDII